MTWVTYLFASWRSRYKTSYHSYRACDTSFTKTNCASRVCVCVCVCGCVCVGVCVSSSHAPISRGLLLVDVERAIEVVREVRRDMGQVFDARESGHHSQEVTRLVECP